MKIAVLLATFNRREKTLACLESLYKQIFTEGTSFDVFLTDDSSSDGTPEAVKSSFPSVNIFRGSGSLFWAGGMRNSWREALKTNPEYYLLLNDDTVLNPLAIYKLLSYNQKHSNDAEAICIGTTADVSSGKITYGGHRLYSQKNEKSFYIFIKNE